MCPPKSGQSHRIAPTFYATDVKTLDFNNLQDYVNENRFKVSTSSLSDKGWSLVNEQSQSLLDKLRKVGMPLGEYVKGKIYYGIKTGLNEAFVIDEETKKRLIKEDSKSAELIKPFLVGKDIKRYEPPEKGRYLILIPKGWTREHSHNARSAWNWLKENYPAITTHLQSFTEKAQKRYDKGEYWWELRACDYYNEFEKPKMILPDISVRGNFMFDEAGGQFSVNTTYIICSSDKFLLAILNSSLMTFFYKNSFAAYRGGYLRFFTQYIEQLPIRTIDFNNPPEKAIHDKLVSLVDRMLDLHKKKNSMPLSAERDKIEREIVITDEKIDEIVYGLYGITDEEREIIKA